MFAAPFSRMLWKEYRSLRMLWAGCALGTLGLWLMMYLVTVLSSDSTQPPLELMHVYWSLALWLPAIYLLGCTVATFAGEKEERTAEWLINTARPFGSLFTAKVIWPVLSAVAMQLMLFGAAALIRRYFLTMQTIETMPADETLPELPGLAAFALLEALIWGLFWSLQLTKPMPAAVLAASCIVVVNLGTISYSGTRVWEPWLAPWSLLRTAGVVALFVADLALARRWIAGRGIEWSIPWHRFVVHRTVTHAMPAVEHAATWRRAWQRFRWLEGQSTRIFLIFTVLWALLTAIPMFFWPRQMGPGPTFISLFFLPLFAGLAAWQGEQSRFQFRFLAYRGVSPYGLWWNKFVRWLTTLIVATLVVVITNWLGHELGQAVFLNDGNISARISFAAGQLEPVGAMTYVGAYLMLYFSAFTVALYFRRTIFAFGAGLILHIALFYWCVASYYLNLPIWFSLLPLMAWLVWCSLRHLPRWYLERSGWRWNAVIAAEWLVFPALFAAAVTSYWVYSVPLPNVAQLLATAPRPISSNAGSSIDGEWTEVLNRAQQVALELERHGPQATDVGVWTIPAPQWSRLEPDVRGLRDALLKPAGMGLTTAFGAKSAQAGLTSVRGTKVVLSLMQLAEHDTAAGKLDDAILSIRAAVRYAGALNADAGLNLYSSQSLDQHHSLYAALEHWVRRPEVTPELVQRTLANLEKYELRWWLTDPIKLEGMYQAELKELDRIEASMGFRRWFLKPWLARQRRLKACELSNQLRFLRTPATGAGYGGLVPGMHTIDPDPAWSYWSHQQPTTYYSAEASAMPVGLSPDVIVAMRDRETRIRGTFAMLAAEGYRKRQGDLPSDLSQTVPQLASGEMLMDPWSGRLLQIRPHGVPGDLGTANQMIHEIKPGVPFIWSVGPFGYQLHELAGGQSFRFLLSDQTVPYLARSTYYVFPLWLDPKSEPKDDRPADALQPNDGQAEALPHPDPFGDATLAPPVR